MLKFKTQNIIYGLFFTTNSSKDRKEHQFTCDIYWQLIKLPEYPASKLGDSNNLRKFFFVCSFFTVTQKKFKKILRGVQPKNFGGA